MDEKISFKDVFFVNNDNCNSLEDDICIVGHEEYIEKVLKDFSNESIDNYFDRLDVESLNSRFSITFDSKTYNSSKNDKIIDGVIGDITSSKTVKSEEYTSRVSENSKRPTESSMLLSPVYNNNNNSKRGDTELKNKRNTTEMKEEEGEGESEGVCNRRFRQRDGRRKL